MRRGEADRNEQVLALPLLRRQRSVADHVWVGGADADVPLVLHEAILGHVALHMVRIHGIGAHPDRLGRLQPAEAVVLGHHVDAEHPPGLADIDLVGPVAVVGEFVLGQPPAAHRLADIVRHPRIVGQEVHQSLLVPLVFGDDLPPPLVGGVGVVVIEADVVRAEGAVVVRVGLVVGDRVELAECFAPAGREHPQEQFVLARIVALGLGERQAVLLRVGQAHAEAIGLHPAVARAVLTGRFGRDARQQAARPVARLDEGRDPVGEGVAVVADVFLHPVELLAVGLRRFAADRVADPGGRHQIAFVGGVDEHPSPVGLAVERRDRADAAVFFLHATRPIEAGLADDGHVGLGDHRVEDVFGGVGLEYPHRALLAVDGRGALALVAIFFPLLPAPGSVVLVVPPDAVVELASQPADHLLAPGVGPTEASACQAAQMPFRRDKDHGPAGPRRLDRGRHPGGSAAVDHQVVGFFSRRSGCRGKQRNENHGGSEHRKSPGLEFSITRSYDGARHGATRSRAEARGRRGRAGISSRRQRFAA